MSRQYGNIVYKTVSEGRVNVITTDWTALRATSTANLSKRQAILVFNRSNKKLFLTTDNTSDIRKTFAIGGGEFMEFPLAEETTLYGRSHSGSAQTIVWEFA